MLLCICNETLLFFNKELIFLVKIDRLRIPERDLNNKKIINKCKQIPFLPNLPSTLYYCLIAVTHIDTNNVFDIISSLPLSSIL